MPIYEFSPRDIGNPAWLRSTYKGLCRVHAPDELRARELLDREFRVSVGRGPATATPASPWKDSTLARCVGTTGSPLWEYRGGLIEVVRGGGLGGVAPIDEDGHGRWVAINLDKLLQRPQSRGERKDDSKGNGGAWGTARWGGSPEEATALESTDGPDRDNASTYTKDDDGNADSAATHDVIITPSPAEARASVFGPTISVHNAPRITRHTVRRVLRNRAVLQFQASALLDFLNDHLGPEGLPRKGRNAPSLADTLGIPEGETADDLLAILRELRDELRRFNDALESQNVEPGALANFRDTALKSAAVAFGATIGTGAGGLLVTATGGLLDSAGLVTWGRFIELITALRG